MKKEKYIKKMFLANIKLAKKTIKSLYNECKEIEYLPNDCTNVKIDGFVCENKDYKIDILTNHMYTIGYMVGLKALSKNMMILNEMSKKKFKKYLINEKIIHKKNKETFKKLKK